MFYEYIVLFDLVVLSGIKVDMSDSLFSGMQSFFEVDYVSIQNEPQYLATWASCILDPTEGNGNAGYDKAFETVWQKFATTFGKSAMPRFVAPEHQSTGVSKMNEYVDATIIYNPGGSGMPHRMRGSDPATYGRTCRVPPQSPPPVR